MDYRETASDFASTLSMDEVMDDLAQVISDLGLADCYMVRTLIGFGMDTGIYHTLVRLHPTNSQLRRLN